MTVAELTHGRGAQMSAAELAVWWPVYGRYKTRELERQQRQLEQQHERRQGSRR